jgi:predicted nucleic acid-binding protein
MIVTDASIWVSALRYNDIHRQATLIWLNEYIATNHAISAPTLLMAEVSGAVARRTGRSRLGHEALKELRGFDFLRLIPIDQQLATVAAELAADYRLRGADAVYAALAYSLDVPLLTCDREQMTRVQDVVKAGTPGTLFGSNAHTEPPQ